MQIILTAESVCAVFVGICIITQYLNHNDLKSSKALRLCTVLMFIWLVVDIAAYTLNGPMYPPALLWLLNLLAYTIGGLVFIVFVQYCSLYINDRVSLKRWILLVPIIVTVINEMITVALILAGKIFVYNNGYVAVVGGIPKHIQISHIMMLLYLPVVAFVKRKAIGKKAVFVLGFYGLAPILAILILFSTGVELTLVFSSVSVVIVVSLLQRDEVQKQITAINNELEKSNAELLEKTEEQKNDLAIVSSLANAYLSAYYINLKTEMFTEIRPTTVQTVGSNIGESGNAREKFKVMSENLVIEDQKQLALDFSDLSTLNERLRDRNIISCEFIGPTIGWWRGDFVAISRDDNGNCTYVLWLVSSIKEQKEYQEKLKKALEEAEAASNAKTDFLFNMSHDIRTPMNAIMGFRDLLEKYQDDPEKRADYLKKIEESSKVLLSIINNVLEMSRIEKGTIEIEESVWSAEQFSDSVYSIFNEMMVQKDIEFTRQIDVKNPYVYCDAIKLREVLFNIISNAYKYTAPGGKVNMRLEEIPSNREDYVVYRTIISDTGIGMSEEFLPHIFEEFTRENNTTEIKIEGTGLGMSIVKRLVELMNGTIEVESEKGVGSTFTLTIPHRIADKSSLVERAGVEIDPKLFEGKRILLAEDNDLNAEIAMEILGEIGFLVERAEDGNVCCEMLLNSEDKYYDLILMDIQMPNMNGYEATRKIRKMQNSTKADIHIIAMTANAFEEDKREALRAGMNGHVAKPINLTELLKALSLSLG